MIGYIKGSVLDSDGKKAILLTSSGVGYEINYGYFASVGSELELFIHHHISENDASLWGFNNLVDKKMFEFLKTVNKVGSSKAYPLIASVGIDSVIRAIKFDDPAALSKAQGIGKKMAEQIILSLKDKVENFELQHMKGKIIIDKNQEEATIFDTTIMGEVIQALEALGYKDKELSSLVKKQFAAGESNSATIIKNVLREI